MTVGCSFNPPADPEALKQVQENNDWDIPKDYEAFLLQHNGAQLLQAYLGDMNIGGGLILFSLDEVIQAHQNLSMDHMFYPIGMVSEEYLMVKNNKNTPNYLYIEYLDPAPLNMNLELFVDRYIVSSGDIFWEWPRLDAINYYKFYSTFK
ncbi:SMI1/KNR4 family protein [Siminovitchia sp. FSL W7-1587]|uniref:SMI1/KNR4 family protein n=1 Tax=Siminovitchia sp. FSL W7-1587 TaxID=2954699 RepID=UPI0030CEDC84